MNNFKSVSASIDLKRWEEIGKKRGLDVSVLHDKEALAKAQAELDNRTRKEALEAIKRNRKRWIKSQSLFSGDIPISFNASMWDINRQPNKALAKELGNRAYRLTQQMKETPLNVILLGDRGVGKTALALLMLNWLEEDGKSVLFVSTAELAGLFELSYMYTDVRDRIERIKRAMIETDVLLLDDFGTEGGMKDDIKAVRRDMQMMLYRVFNARVDFESNTTKKSTIITTNNYQDELEIMYNTKLISRLVPRNKEQRLSFSGMEEVRNV